MGDLEFGLWDVLGLAFLGLASYMVIVRVIMPRFASPWVSKRQRNEAIERATELLAKPELDDDTRHTLQRALNTLRANGAGRESWSGQVPVSDIVKEVDEIWDSHRPDRP